MSPANTETVSRVTAAAVTLSGRGSGSDGEGSGSDGVCSGDSTGC